MVILNSKPECDFDALVHALRLLLTAHCMCEEKDAKCTIRAGGFAARLSEKEVTRAKNMIEPVAE